MQRKQIRPARCEPGSMKGREPELWARVCLSRERLAASELAKVGRAWRLWSAGIDQTEGYAREADTIYIGTLARTAGAMDRKAASQLMSRFHELGVFVWKAAPRGSHGISELALPPLAGQRLHVVPTPHEDVHVVPTPHEDASTWGVDTPLQSNEVMSDDVMSNAHNSSIDTGEQHSSLIATSEGLDVLGSGVAPQEEPAETGAPGETGPARCATPGCGGAAFSDGLCIDCDRARFYASQPSPFDRDERTGDTIGDDEASQMRWASANPRKARARRRHD